MALTFLSVLILCSCFILFLIFTMYFLGHIELLFGFQKETKETSATVVGFITRGLDTPDDPQSANPIIEYYNAFSGQTVRKEMFNSGMIAQKDAVFKKQKKAIVTVGERVTVQYTKKKVRVIDPRSVSPNTYKLSRYIMPLVACVVVAFIGFIMLVISIL